MSICFQAARKCFYQKKAKSKLFHLIYAQFDYFLYSFAELKSEAAPSTSRPATLKVMSNVGGGTVKGKSPLATTPAGGGGGGASPNKVGQSVFYDCIDGSPLCEKQDVERREKSDTEENDDGSAFILLKKCWNC